MRKFDKIIRKGDTIYQCLFSLCPRRWYLIKKHPNRKNCCKCGNKLFIAGIVVSSSGTKTCIKPKYKD